jgi:hypothetical protein
MFVTAAVTQSATQVIVEIVLVGAGFLIEDDIKIIRVYRPVHPPQCLPPPYFSLQFLKIDFLSWLVSQVLSNFLEGLRFVILPFSVQRGVFD